MKKIHTHHALGVIIVKVRRDETMWGSTWKESGVFVYVIVRMQKYVFVGVGWCVDVCVCVLFWVQHLRVSSSGGFVVEGGCGCGSTKRQHRGSRRDRAERVEITRPRRFQHVKHCVHLKIKT